MAISIFFPLGLCNPLKSGHIVFDRARSPVQNCEYDFSLRRERGWRKSKYYKMVTQLHAKKGEIQREDSICGPDSDYLGLRTLSAKVLHILRRRIQ